MTQRQKILTAFVPQFYRPFGFLPLNGVGVELGSREGRFAKTLLKKPRVERLYIVDPFHPYQDGDNSCVTAEMQERYLQNGRNRLRKFHQCHRILQTSELASKEFADESLDFIYIDGDHSYDAAKSDITCWWPKMKTGAFFGGHDFHHTWPGVVRAVLEHVNSYHLQLHVETPDWWVIKTATSC